MISTNYIPNAIKNLKLMSAFRGYNPGILDCIETSRGSRIMVVDNAEGSHISTDAGDLYRCCLCINPNNNEIVVLPLDKRLVKQRTGGMADGAIFDEQKFVFVEFKDQAQGKYLTTIERTYSKASSQLSAALQLFIEKLATKDICVDFLSSVNVSCHIIVSDKFPRTSAIEQNMRLLFAIENKGVDLSFEKEILFNDRAGRSRE